VAGGTGFSFKLPTGAKRVKPGTGARVIPRRVPRRRKYRARMELNAMKIGPDLATAIREGASSRKIKQLIKDSNYPGVRHALDTPSSLRYVSWPRRGKPSLVFSERIPLLLAARGRAMKISPGAR